MNKDNKDKGLFIIYLVLFSASVLNPSLNTVCLAAIVLFNFVVIVSRSGAELPVLSTMVLGDEVFSLANAVVCVLGLLIIHKSVIIRNRKGINDKYLIIGVLIIANSIISGLISNTWINALFYIGYLLILLICYRAFHNILDIRKAYKAITHLVIIEFVATIIRVYLLGSVHPGDFFAGTMINAHFFGNWIVMTLYVLYVFCKNRRIYGIRIHKTRFYCVLCMSAVMLYLADAKGILLSLVIAVALHTIVAFLSNKKRNVVFWAIVGMYFSYVLIIWVLSLPSIKAFMIGHFQDYSDYLYREGWNGRYRYSYGTFFESLANLRVFLGYGLGQYGSRVSNAFAYTEMWRNENFFNNFIASTFQPHFLGIYSKYISFFNDELARQIQWRSAVLSYPFSSFVALLSETGVIGVLYVARLINKAYCRVAFRFLIIYFFSICLLDIYFDNFPCVIALIIYVGAFRSTESQLRESDEEKTKKAPINNPICFPTSIK